MKIKVLRTRPRVFGQCPGGTLEGAKKEEEKTIRPKTELFSLNERKGKNMRITFAKKKV